MSKEFELLIGRYIKSKDESKPHLMRHVFSEGATLKMKVKTDNISFPSEAEGLESITNTLVHEFNNSYENIYTICLSDTVEQGESILKCRWLVGMTGKDSGLVRVGFGDYQWQFECNEEIRVSHLAIAIENMVVLAEENRVEVMMWFENMSYPWAITSEVLESMPNIASLASIRDFA